MQKTKLIYLEDFTKLQDKSTILDINPKNDLYTLILDQTIFYPQGGGQPYDTGIIENEAGKFLVGEVRFVDGFVKHIGKFEYRKFDIGDLVNCTVNKKRRELNSRLHSAGHVIDMAVNTLKLNWILGKAFHFPDGPYVEYTGNLEGHGKEKLKIDLENLSNKFIKEETKTKLIFMDKEEMKKICPHVPDYLPAGKPSRVVMYGNFGVPCGGTHVSKLSDIKKISVRKIKQSGSNIRVGYDIEK